MHGSRVRRAAWRGWLISLILHALTGVGLLYGLRHAPPPTLSPVPDNLYRSKELNLTIWDESVTIAAPKSTPPIAPAPPAASAPSIGPIEPVVVAPRTLPADVNSAPPLTLVKPQPSSIVPVEPPRGVGTNNPIAGTVQQAGHSSGIGTGHATGSRLPVSAAARSVVFVLDRSASMGIDDRIARAREQILACLRQMPASTRFQVVCYNSRVSTVSIDNKTGLVPATPGNIDKLAEALEEIVPEGGNSHEPALMAALNLEPDVICLLTDADDLREDMVRRITARNRGHAAIHAVTIGSAPRQTMQLLAGLNRGTCVAISERK